MVQDIFSFQRGDSHNTNDDHNKIIGLVTTTDIAKYLREKIQPTATAIGPDEMLWEAMYLADDDIMMRNAKYCK